MRKGIVILFVLVVMCSGQSFGWGKKGHNMVAEVAWSLLDENTRQNVKKYLDGYSIDAASTWMDDVRSDHRYDFMKKWHYIDVNKGEVYDPNTKEENAINELTRVITELQHKENMKKEDIQRDLLVLFHLVGDLHQPLHCGYPGDKGGNEIQVKYKSHPSNLHRVWDSEIIESENITVNDCLLGLSAFTKDEIKSLSDLNVINWTRQPRSQLKQVYNFTNDFIDDDYIQKGKKLIEGNILLGGIRLAAVLKEVCKS